MTPGLTPNHDSLFYMCIIIPPILYILSHLLPLHVPVIPYFNLLRPGIYISIVFIYVCIIYGILYVYVCKMKCCNV